MTHNQIIALLGFDPKPVVAAGIKSGAIKPNAMGSAAWTNRQCYQARAAKNLAKGLTVDGKVRKRGYCHHPELDRFRHDKHLYNVNKTRLRRGKPLLESLDKGDLTTPNGGLMSR